MYKKPLEAYQTIESTTISGRGTEARVLNKAAQQLSACQKKWESNDRERMLNDAIKFNQRIWSIFQAELMKKDNPIPEEIKYNLLRLSAFIDKRIFEIMAFPDKDKLSIIININKNIAAGLMNDEHSKSTKETSIQNVPNPQTAGPKYLRAANHSINMQQAI